MYKFRVYIYLIRVPFCACQKSYGFKNLMKLGGGQTNFKICLGTRVFKKSCLTSNLARVGALFDKFYGFFVQNREDATWPACHAKPNLADSSQSGRSATYQVKYCISLTSLADSSEAGPSETY